MEMTVHTAKPYEILLERGLLSRAGEECAKLFAPGARVMIISDSNVYPLFGEKVAVSLREAGFRVFSCTFPAGEQSKQLSTVEGFYRALAENHFTRSDFVVALGGGVTGDMAGFAAATFLRGIDFVQVPTSLLAQVDSSVGGKTGVDLPFGKNLVGAFHQPRLVLIDPDTLDALPPHFFADGMGEVIKYGCIRDKDLFENLEKQDVKEHLEEVIFRCVDCKRRIVEADALEKGERMLLNFGHTLCHAMEKLRDFQGLSHGEAVGIGMVLISQAGEKAGLTQPGTADRIAALLEKYGLPTKTTDTPAELAAAASLDKKTDGDNLHLILLQSIGEACIHTIPAADLLGFLQ